MGKTVDLEVAGQGTGLHVHIPDHTLDIGLQIAGRIQLGDRIQFNQALNIHIRVGDRARALQFAGDRDIKGLIERDPAGIDAHVVQAHVYAAELVLIEDGTVLHFKTGNVDFEVGFFGLGQHAVALRRDGGLRTNLVAFEARVDRLKRGRVLSQQILKIEAAFFITHDPALQAGDRNMVDHQTV